MQQTGFSHYPIENTCVKTLLIYMSIISTHTSQVHHNKAWNSLEAKGEHILWHSTAAHDRGRVCKLWVHGYKWWESEGRATMETCLVRVAVHLGWFVVGHQCVRHSNAVLHGRWGCQCWYSGHTGSVLSAGNFRVLITLSILTALKIWMLLQYCVQAPSFMAGSCTRLHHTGYADAQYITQW